MGAAAGGGAALGLTAKQLVDALGVAGSMASGIIEYLAEGAWTKRLHPGWAAQAGPRAALLAKHGFVGPRTAPEAGRRAALLAKHGFVGPRAVLEGTHGLFNAFAHTTAVDYDSLTEGFG